MSTTTSLNTAATAAPAADAGSADPTSTPDGSNVRLADGLRGALGLYQVDLNGETRFMTRQELEAADLQQLGEASGGGGGDKAKPGSASNGNAQPKTADGSVKVPGGHAKAVAEAKWADSFRTQADAKLQQANIPADQRQRITDHLATLSGPALAKEARLLDHALKSPNVERSIGTYDKTLSMSKESPRAAERLGFDMREELVRGVADRRTPTDKGTEGVLGQRQAAEAARALIDMPKAAYERLQGAMSRAGENAAGKPAKGADAHTESALMLKAVAARGERLKETPLDIEAQRRNVCMDTPAGRAMGEIDKFAGDVRGMRRDKLIESTTPLAINRVDSGPDADKLPDGNTKTDVGHYQRYDTSCGPTTAQNVQGERDPVYSLKLHQESNIRGVDSDLARQQKRVLETEGVAVSRLGTQAESRLSARLGGDWAQNNLSSAERSAAAKFMTNQKTTPAEDTLAQRAFDKLRANGGGQPSAEELQAMRSNYTQNADGTSTLKRGAGMRLPGALNDIAPPPAGKTWSGSATNSGNGGMSNAEITSLDTRLKGGTDVPIRIANANNSGGHFMLISDVRGTGADKVYLVSDPWSGRTAWVPQSDLQSNTSNWPQTYLHSGLASRISHVYAES